MARHLLRALEAGLRLDVLEVELAVVSRHVEADAVVRWVGRPERAVGGGQRRLLGLAEEDLALRVPRRAERVERVHHPRRVVAAAAGRAAAPLAAHLAQRPRRRRDQVERRARVVGVHNQHVLAELGGLVPGRVWGGGRGSEARGGAARGSSPEFDALSRRGTYVVGTMQYALAPSEVISRDISNPALYGVFSTTCRLERRVGAVGEGVVGRWGVCASSAVSVHTGSEARPIVAPRPHRSSTVSGRPCGRRRRRRRSR